MLAELLQKIDENQIRINRYRPFEDKDILREIQKYYRVDSVFSSNALEGSSYTLVETKILLEDGLTAGGKPLKDALAVVGLGKAYDHASTCCAILGLPNRICCGCMACWKGASKTTPLREPTDRSPYS